MNFIRKINRNVQESFSIINEGIQITNGILEVRNTHLPLLMQLSPEYVRIKEEGGVCCLFEEYVDRKVRGVRSSQLSPQGSVESHEISPKDRFRGRFKLVQAKNTGFGAPREDAMTLAEDPGCVLGHKCVLRNFSHKSYSESLSYVSFFLNTLSRVLEDSNHASRRVVENQVFSVLYEISHLYEVTIFLKFGRQSLSKILQDVDSVHSSMLTVVGFSLKLLNDILRYPLGIFLESLSREYDETKVERKKYDSSINQMFPDHNVDNYDLVGSFAFINLTPEESAELDQYLYYLDTILDISSDSRLVLEAFGHLCEENEGNYGEVIQGFLTLFQKLFSYNDLNWHLAHNDPNTLYFCNRYYDQCSYFLYSQGHCYDCTKPKMESDPSMVGDYCSCFLGNQRCNFRVKVVVEELLKSDANFVRMLFRTLSQQREPYLKSGILSLMLQFMSQVEVFGDLFHSHGTIEAVFEILEFFARDQFYLLDTTLNVVSYQEYKPLSFLSLVRDQDLRILMSFPPCTIECALLIHNHVVGSRWKTSAKNKTVLSKLAKDLVVVYTYYKCTYQSSNTLEMSGLFSQVLSSILESELFMRFSLKDLPMKKEAFCLHLIEKLSVLDLSVDIWELRKALDPEMLNLIVCSFVVLTNLARLGTFVEYQVIQSISCYLGYSFVVLNFLTSTYPDLVDFVSGFTVSHLPQVYRHMLSMLYTKETSLSEHMEDVVRLKVESFLDLNTKPLFLLAFTLLDPFINTRVTSKFTRDVFGLCHKMSLFSPESEIGRSLGSWISQKCNELSVFLDQEFEDGKFVLLRKFVFNYLSILSSQNLKEPGFPKALFLQEYGLEFIILSISRIVGILKFKSGPNLEAILMYFLKFLLNLAFTLENSCLLATLEWTPLFDLVGFEGGSGFLLISMGVASVILLYIILVGLIPDDRVQLLGEMCDNVNRLYRCNEFLASQAILKVANMEASDTLGKDFDVVVNNFLSNLSDTTKTDLVGLLFWNRNNFYNFSLPPHLFKALIAFKFYLHPHLFGRLSRKIDSPKVPLKPPEQVPRLLDTNLIDDSLLDKPALLLKTLYTEEMEYARKRINALENQLHVLTNSLRLSQITNQNLRNKIRFLERQLEGPSGEESFNLELELEIEHQRYSHLEKTCNQLLSQLNALTFSRDNTQ